MGKPCSCMQFIKSYIFATSHSRIRISTTSYARIHISYYNSRVLVWTCNEIEGSYDEIIITIVPNYTVKKKSLICCRWHCYSCCALVTIRSSTALYYGDTHMCKEYIMLERLCFFVQWKFVYGKKLNEPNCCNHWMCNWKVVTLDRAQWKLTSDL